MINSSANFEVHPIHCFLANREALSGFLLILCVKHTASYLSYHNMFVNKRYANFWASKTVSWEEPPLHSGSFKGRNILSKSSGRGTIGIEGY